MHATRSHQTSKSSSMMGGIVSGHGFLLSLGLLLLLALLQTGCASSKQNVRTADPAAACPRPDWVDNPVCEGGICAVGVGKSMDYGFAREKAEAAGRNKLAQNLETEVRNLFEDFKEENRDLVNPNASSGNDFTASVTQQLTATTLSGSRAMSYWTDCVGGDVFVLMVLDADRLQRQLKTAVAKAAENSRAIRRVEKDKAIERMNRIIDERRDEAFARDAGTGK